MESGVYNDSVFLLGEDFLVHLSNYLIVVELLSPDISVIIAQFITLVVLY